jgi:acyl-CoA synthetase (AMP-forming)/AMP-acid ligase II
VPVEKGFLGLDFDTAPGVWVIGTPACCPRAHCSNSSWSANPLPFTAGYRESTFEDIATTFGKACAGMELRVVDDGELLVRGYRVMKGYLDDPVATAAAVDPDG